MKAIGNLSMKETAMFERPIDATPRIEISRKKSFAGQPGPIVCQLVWETDEEIDRLDGYGIQISSYMMELAERYQKAVADGAIFTNPRRAYDVNGNTYIVCDGFVMGKYLEETVDQLGY